jgi:STE24 endopeptidase
MVLNDLIILMLTFSDYGNNLFYSLRNNKRIVLYDTLISRLNDQEILAVFTHELGHWKYRHAYINIVVFILKILFIFYVFSLFRN